MIPDAPDLDLLEAFLSHEDRALGTLSLMELQGMIFAFAAAPETVPFSELLELLFDDDDPRFSTMEEANAVLASVTALHNQINKGVLAREPVLPEGCVLHDDAMANFDPEGAISHWSRGFREGFGWVQDDWDEWLPDELEEDFGAAIMILTFFASREMAEDAREELEEGGTTLERVAEDTVRLFSDALNTYAVLGRSIHEARYRMEEEERRRREMTQLLGRNDPCPCGSGKKLKGCCGAVWH